jgi:hypothetical protein
MVTVASFVAYAETVTVTPIAVAKIEKYTVVVAAPSPAFGKYAERKDVKSKFALTVTVTLRKLDSSSSVSHCLLLVVFQQGSQLDKYQLHMLRSTISHKYSRTKQHEP